jgi:hypothetical protein
MDWATILDAIVHVMAWLGAIFLSYGTMLALERALEKPGKEELPVKRTARKSRDGEYHWGQP